MRLKLEIRKVGNSLGVIFPKEFLQALNVTEGDALYVVDEDGGALLTPYDPNFEKAMDAYNTFARKYRNALRELSK